MTKKLSEVVAQYIRIEMARRDMDQVDVAKQAGIPVATFGRYYHGQRGIPMDVLPRVARVFKMSAGELIDRAEAEAQRPS